MTTELLRAKKAADRLGISTGEVVRLMFERKIRYVLVDGIPHIPEDALEEFRGKAS